MRYIQREDLSWGRGGGVGGDSYSKSPADPFKLLKILCEIPQINSPIGDTTYCPSFLHPSMTPTSLPNFQKFHPQGPHPHKGFPMKTYSFEGPIFTREVGSHSFRVVPFSLPLRSGVIWRHCPLWYALSELTGFGVLIEGGTFYEWVFRRWDELVRLYFSFAGRTCDVDQWGGTSVTIWTRPK
jgi:hypothetical protein